MTHDALYTNGNAVEYGANPLYDKLRSRFSFGGNRTVGEAACIRALKEGFNPYEKKNTAEAVRRPAVSAAEKHAQVHAGSVRAANTPAARAGFRPAAANRSLVLSNQAGALERRAVTRQARTPELAVKKPPFPMGAMIIIVVCALMFAFVVYSGVQINKMTREIAELNRKAADLSESEDSLGLQLDKKNDLRVIEQIATGELGMVKRDQILQKYLCLNNGDRIEVYSTSESGVGTGTTLLSAAAENFGKLMEYLD